MKRHFLFAALSGFLLFVSCGTMSHPDPNVQRGRRVGAATGAIAGGVIGNNTDLGTAGGIAVGAVLGGVLGDTAGKTNSMYYGR